MHLLVRESRDLDEAQSARDLGLAPADIVFLSYSDSDLAIVAAAWRAIPAEVRPSLRCVNLKALAHPMSVDLFADATIKDSKAVLVRLLGGLDYWRYGGEQLARHCQARGITLAMLSGDGRTDPRLAALSSVSGDDLGRIEGLLQAGGIENAGAVLSGLLRHARGELDAFAELRPVPDFGVYRSMAAVGVSKGTAAIVFYRSHLLAGDVAPVDALSDALVARGLDTITVYVPSLKATHAATWLRGHFGENKPDVIINATAFSARDGDSASPLDSCDCPVLQVALANASREMWDQSQRGLSASDLAMNVVLPEFDGRLFAGVISFKEADPGFAAIEPPLVRHVPYGHGIDHVADLALAWARLRRTPRAQRQVGLLLSTYPGRPDQIAHAVGLDALLSTVGICRQLELEGYKLSQWPQRPQDLVALLSVASDCRLSLDKYRQFFAELLPEFRQSVEAAWGDAENDAFLIDDAFHFRAAQFGNLTVGLQPERGTTSDRKAEYHDPATPPRHSYIAFYLWLRHRVGVDALIHLGAHGTLEWLPGKAIAGSADCAPRALLGPLPLIYPFIANDPGEAAQAKRRVAAVTLGHRPPPMTSSSLSGDLADVGRLVDEFSSAEGLDPRRRKILSGQIVDAAVRAGIAERCGLESGMATNDALMRIDAFLCDVKELNIRDGLHVLDDIELGAIVRALDGRFIAPGPAGAPSRGRADVLPTGRNLYSVDPRSIPTPTAWTNGRRAASAILERYLSDHGQWPRAIVLDLWGSATLRTGGEELATALSLLGVRPRWDDQSYRVVGVETEPLAVLGRPRVDVTLRISGLFRDMFAAQLTLFDSAVDLVAGLAEDEHDNPLAAVGKTGVPLDRIFGPADGSFGAGVMAMVDSGDWADRGDLGRSYIASSAQAYGRDSATSDANAFSVRVETADAFVHIQDHREIDLLTGGDFAAHEGGFAAAAHATGNDDVVLYHADTGAPEVPRVRTLEEECARVVHGRAANVRWIEGQMRHGFRGAAEIAQSVDAAFAFAATARSVDNGAFERLYEAYLGDPAVAAFIERENPQAIDAMRKRFEEAIARGLWQPRRNDTGLRRRETRGALS